MSPAVTGLENRDVALPIVWGSMAYAERRQSLASVAVQPVADRHRNAPCRPRLNPSAFDLNADGHICKSLITRLIPR